MSPAHSPPSSLLSAQTLVHVRHFSQSSSQRTQSSLHLGLTVSICSTSQFLTFLLTAVWLTTRLPRIPDPETDGRKADPQNAEHFGCLSATRQGFKFNEKINSVMRENSEAVNEGLMFVCAAPCVFIQTQTVPIWHTDLSVERSVRI